jgi:hypothetical protein
MIIRRKEPPVAITEVDPNMVSLLNARHITEDDRQNIALEVAGNEAFQVPDAEVHTPITTKLRSIGSTAVHGVVDAPQKIKELGRDVVVDGGAFIHEVGSVIGVGRQELKDSPRSTKFIAYGTTVLLACHEVGMEFAVSRTGTWVYQRWQNPFLTGTSTGLLSGVVESALTLGISHSLAKNKRTAEEIANRFNSSETDSKETHEDLSETTETEEAIKQNDQLDDKFVANALAKVAKVKDKAIAGMDTVGTLAGLGSPGIILRANGRSSEVRPFKENLITGEKAAGALLASNFVLGTVAAASIWISEHVFHTQDIANWALPALKSPFTFIGLFSFTRSTAYLHNRKIRKSKAEEESIDSPILNLTSAQAESL